MFKSAHPPRRVARPAMLPSVQTLASLLCVLTAAAAASVEPVYLLNAVYSVDNSTAPHANAIWTGVDAALYASNYTTGDGRPLVIVEPDFSATDMSDIVGVVKNALTTYPSLLGVIGPYSDMRLAAVLEDSTLQQANVTFLGPFTGSNAVRTWNNASYFTRADPLAELLVMVRYAANTLRARRTGFMYLTGVNYGDSEYNAVLTRLATLAMAAPVLYARPYVYTNEAVEPVAFGALANTYPQAIFVWGMPGYQVVNFLTAVLTDPRTSSTNLIVSFALEPILYPIVKKLEAVGLLANFKGRILSSATAFPFDYTEAKHMLQFRQELLDYLEKSDAGKLLVSSAGVASGKKYLETMPDVAQLMVAGWLSGKVIQQTLEQPRWIADRNAYRTGLFDQNRYVIGGDFVMGDYGGECDALAAATGAVCRCNQGGRSAYLFALQGSTWELVSGTSFTYAQDLCYSKEVSVPKPVNDLVVALPEFPRLNTLTTNALTILPLAASLVEALATETLNLATLPLNMSSATAALADELANYSVDIISGTLLPDLDIGDVLACDIMYPQPHVSVPKRNYIYTMPTLEQEIYLMYKYLSTLSRISSSGTATNVIVRNYTANALLVVKDLLYQSAATFNVPDPSIVSTSYNAAAAPLLVPNAINMIVGMYYSDAAEIAAFLSAKTQSVVVICFDDLVAYYDDLVAAFTPLPASVQARFLSFSSLPLWSDTSDAAHAASPLLVVLHTLMQNSSNHTPANLRTLATAGFLQTTFSSTTTVSAAALVETIYRNSIVSSYAVSFGPFTWSCMETTAGQSCTYKNYGAQSISLLSMERILDPTVPVTTPPTTPSLVYSARNRTGLTNEQLGGAIAGSVVGAVLLIVAIVLLVHFCSDSRDNGAAPKDGDEPVTLIFTDIESSTAMWATLPQLMTDAIASHHRVIRQLIKKYGCYEVKTVGDSFMIACKDAYSAVQLACDIQRKLLRYEWGTTEIDSTYRNMERAKAEGDCEYQPTTARLSEEEYAALWRGLRVRIGVHTGLSDIRYDEVTKGYDYYGDTSNMAARTEAIANGGQVVATETTWWALSDEEREPLQCTSMGPQGLRGVPFAVGMYQLNPVPGRTHAALRTEIEAILPDDGASETASSAADALLSSSDARSGPAATAVLVLTNTFAPYPPAQRVRELQPLLNKWSVGAPPRPSAVSEEDYCRGLINRLAVRIATVTLAKQRMQQDNAADNAGAGPRYSHDAINPLLGEVNAPSKTGSRHRGVHSTSPSPDTSAMRESRVFGRAAPSGHGPPVPSRKATRVAVTTEVVDSVQPFSVPRSRTPSLRSSAGFGGLHSSLEAITVSMPLELRMLRRRSRSEGSDLLSSELLSSEL